MPKSADRIGADYDALRSALLCVLMEQCSQGRFSKIAESSNEARFVLTYLTHSIVDILVLAYPKPDRKAYAAVIADAEAMVAAVFSGRSSTIH